MNKEFLSQGQIAGPPRNTHHHLKRGSTQEIRYVPRRSRMIFGVDESGDFIYIPGPLLVGLIDPAMLAHLEKGVERLLDTAKQTISYQTAKKKATTMPGFEVPKPAFCPKKTTGFMFSVTAKEIAKERKENELKRQLREAGIDYNKLYLLLHSAYHSQILLERQQSIKRSLPSYKQGGIRPKELEEMKKQRRKWHSQKL